MRYIPFTLLSQLLAITDPAQYGQFYTDMSAVSSTRPDMHLVPHGGDVFVPEATVQAYGTANKDLSMKVAAMGSAFGQYYGPIPGTDAPVAPPMPAAPVANPAPVATPAPAPTPAAPSNVVAFNSDDAAQRLGAVLGQMPPASPETTPPPVPVAPAASPAAPPATPTAAPVAPAAPDAKNEGKPATKRKRRTKAQIAADEAAAAAPATPATTAACSAPARAVVPATAAPAIPAVGVPVVPPAPVEQAPAVPEPGANVPSAQGMDIAAAEHLAEAVLEGKTAFDKIEMRNYVEARIKIVEGERARADLELEMLRQFKNNI